MGCSQANGSLQLEVSTNQVQTGQDITGVVHFHRSQGLKVDSLSLVFTGNESFQWTETDSDDSDDDDISDSYSARRRGSDIYWEKAPVFQFQSGFVDSGTSTYPFLYRIPTHIPGTFHAREYKMQGHIEYLLTAWIENAGKKVKQSTMEIWVSQFLQPSIHPIHRIATTPVSTCWCRRKGTIEMIVDIRKNAYVPYETAEIEVQVKNASRVDVTWVRATLFRIFTLQVRHGDFKYQKNPLYIQENNRRIPAGTNAVKKHAIRFRLPITNPNGGIQYAASMSRSSMSCAYTIKVEAGVKGCCGTTPEVEEDIVIYSPPPAISEGKEKVD